ncbi:MAG: hypothetical protein HC933_21565, partial [Pleurocapsa sp. SU_196_0]|nr:hypothetical protein [Pleurocapsa sp. SU_196_0]
YALGNLEVSREHFQDVRDGTFSDDARIWETRITLELGDGFVYELPKTRESEHRRLLEAQWALSFGDYHKAWALTQTENDDYPWAWALCRAQAGWRLKRDIGATLEELRTLTANEDRLEIVQPQAQRHVAFVKRALGDEWNASAKLELSRLAQGLRSSSVGLLARDVLLALGANE